MTDEPRCEYVAYPGWPDRWRCIYVKHSEGQHSVAYERKANLEDFVTHHSVSERDGYDRLLEDDRKQTT